MLPAATQCRTRRGEETRDFRAGEFAPSTGGHFSQFDRPDPGAYQANHRVADGVHHPADLPVATFPEDHFQNGRPARHHFHRGRCGGTFAIGDHEAVRQSTQGVVLRQSAHGDPVGLSRAVAGMGDLLDELAVVAEDHQTFGFGVQTTRGHQSRTGNRD